MLIDTHAHIHFSDYHNSLTEIFAEAQNGSVSKIICVGTNAQDSLNCVDFVAHNSSLASKYAVDIFATTGLHPHDAKNYLKDIPKIAELLQAGRIHQIRAVGECGLDYYRNESTKSDQHKALVLQIELALKHNLPLVFHVRDAWGDFFAILKDYPNVRGVIHSFTGTMAEVEQALEYSLYFGINGIATFTKDTAQIEAARLLPVENLLLETDSPFLAPVPMRGKQNQPAYLCHTAEYLAGLRNTTISELASVTTSNANRLFNL